MVAYPFACAYLSSLWNVLLRILQFFNDLLAHWIVVWIAMQFSEAMVFSIVYQFAFSCILRHKHSWIVWGYIYAQVFITANSNKLFMKTNSIRYPFSIFFLFCHDFQTKSRIIINWLKYAWYKLRWILGFFSTFFKPSKLLLNQKKN